MNTLPPPDYSTLSPEEKDKWWAKANRDICAREKANGAARVSSAEPTDDPADAEIPPPNGPDDHGTVRTVSNDALNEEAIDLKIECASSFAGKSIPERPWLVPGLVPDHTVTLLTGDGGVGKSLILLQLGMAVAAAKDWLGTLPETGRVVYVSAEDDLEEIHRRLADITAAQGIDLAALAGLHIVPLAGCDAVLGAPDRRPGIIAATPLWRALVAKVSQIKPRLVILDNLADIFAGNENSRPEARQFIGLLRGLAIEQKLAVVLAAHPSLSGLSSGSGTSGSTHWSNGMRSRLYLDRPKTDDGSEIDPNLRVLRTMKSNYAPLGNEIPLRWEKGCFRLDGPKGGFDKLAAEAKADRVFLDLLAKIQAEGRDVSHKHSSGFAPTVFAQHPDRSGLSKKVLEDAMNRLFGAKKIRVERVGPPSRQHSRIIVVETDTSEESNGDEL